MDGVFVTGTDTGIGKTHVSAALVRTLRRGGIAAIGMKPVASGCESTSSGLRNGDALALIEAAGVELRYEDVNPFAFADPIAPHLAADDKGEVIDPDRIIEACMRLQRDAEFVIVEGVGGWLAPLGDSLMQADLAHALNMPVLLVVGLRLGCLNHALLTARAIAADGCQLIGWIGNHIEPQMQRVEDNIATLKQRIQAPLLGIVEHGVNSCDAKGFDLLNEAARKLLLDIGKYHGDAPMTQPQRYFITIENVSSSRGDSSELSFDGTSPEHLARAFEAALREPQFWERWRTMQEDPDQVDPGTGVVDSSATVSGSLEAERTELIVTTSLPHAIVKHRLDLLIGRHWKLRDVSTP